MDTYNVIVIGAGPSGMMAALRAAQCTTGVVLFEKNASLARKLGLTGKGRCNLTNTADLDDFLKKFGPGGVFLRNAFARFFSDDLMHFFESNGLKLKTERQGRVFPATDSSGSVIDIFKKVLKHRGVEVRLSTTAKSIVVQDNTVRGVRLADGSFVSSYKVVLAVGGSTYPETGSTGDGFRMAAELGHALVPLSGGLVPLETEEDLARDLQGLTLKNIGLIFEAGKKKIVTPIGELLFTHFGVSGPLILDHSADVVRWMAHSPVKMFVDLKPGLASEVLDEKIRREFQLQGSLALKNYLKGILPQRFIDVLLVRAGIAGEKKCHQVSSGDRKKLVVLLKKFPLTIKRPRPISEAMVTCGGVSLKEVDPRTMESKKIKGLYFCGEVLDLSASSGGFNLQAAFSTGFVAGESAGLSC